MRILLLIAFFSLVLLLSYPVVFKNRVMASDQTMELVTVAAAATEFFRAHGTWPVSLAEIQRKDPNGNIKVLKGRTNDFWGRPFIFQPFETNRGYGLFVSQGRDGLPGGKGADRDIFFAFTEDQARNIATTERLRKD
jgi:hypothetical protein